MKKIFFLIALVSVSYLSQAQSAIRMSLAAGDTIANTGTATKVLPRLTAGYSGAVIQMVYVKLSGTGAGTSQVQGSNDGVTYTNIGSAYTITNTFPQSNTFIVTAPLPQYLRVLSTGSGTESVVQTLWYRLPKYQHD